MSNKILIMDQLAQLLYPFVEEVDNFHAIIHDVLIVISLLFWHKFRFFIENLMKLLFKNKNKKYENKGSQISKSQNKINICPYIAKMIKVLCYINQLSRIENSEEA